MADYSSEAYPRFRELDRKRAALAMGFFTWSLHPSRSLLTRCDPPRAPPSSSL